MKSHGTGLKLWAGLAETKHSSRTSSISYCLKCQTNWKPYAVQLLAARREWKNKPPTGLKGNWDISDLLHSPAWRVSWRKWVPTTNCKGPKTYLPTSRQH